MKRGLCDDNLQLTDKGMAWAASSPEELLSPQLSNMIEKACDRILPGMMVAPERKPRSILAEKIAGSLPDSLSKQMLGDLEPDALAIENPCADTIARVDGVSVDTDEPEGPSVRNQA